MKLLPIEKHHRLDTALVAIFLFATTMLFFASANVRSSPLYSAPEATILVYAYSMPDDGWAPLTVHFSPYGSRTSSSGVTRYTWDLDGDGFYESDATQNNGYISHTYTNPGKYQVGLQVMDERGRYNTASTQVEVRHPASSSVDYWTVFDQNKVNRIELQFTQKNWNTLWQAPSKDTEVPASIILFGERFDQVGISMKGNGSLGGSGAKKPWKIDFNEYIEGQEFRNLSMLLLHNNFGDPSMLREQLAYDMLRFAGVPSGFVSYVEVWVDISDDDQPAGYWGVYSMVERPDSKFLASRFGSGNDSGNLYKADAWFEQGAADLAYYGPDISSYPMPRNRVAYRKMPDAAGHDYSDIINLCYTIDGVDYETPAAWASAVEEVLNVDGYLRYLAASFLHLNLDTYPYTGNNYYIYNNPGSGKFEWIAWDENSSWAVFGGDVNFPLYGHTESLGPLQDAPLFVHAFEVERYRQDYRAYMDLLVRHWFNADHIAAEAQRHQELVAPYLIQSTGDRAYYGDTALFNPQDFVSERQRIIQLTQQRSQFIWNALAQEESSK
jgi:spore coat protein H